MFARAQVEPQISQFNRRSLRIKPTVFNGKFVIILERPRPAAFDDTTVLGLPLTFKVTQDASYCWIRINVNTFVAVRSYDVISAL